MFVLCGHSIAVKRKLPSEHLIVAVCVVVAAGEAGQVAVARLTEPFQHVWVETGGATVGAGPPLFSQEI